MAKRAVGDGLERRLSHDKGPAPPPPALLAQPKEIEPVAKSPIVEDRVVPEIDDQPLPAVSPDPVEERLLEEKSIHVPPPTPPSAEEDDDKEVEEPLVVPQIRRNSMERMDVIEYNNDEPDNNPSLPVKWPPPPPSGANDMDVRKSRPEINGGWKERTRSTSNSNRNRRRPAPPPLSEEAINALAKPSTQPFFILNGKIYFFIIVNHCLVKKKDSKCRYKIWFLFGVVIVFL